jgi:hypothetical protein
VWILADIAAALVALWGVAHAVPTRRVVAGFGAITPDNRRVLIQEWLAEALMMWGIAALIVVVTTIGSATKVTAWVYRVAGCQLLAVAVLTVMTGARTSVLWFKICPVLLSAAAAMLLIAGGD